MLKPRAHGFTRQRTRDVHLQISALHPRNPGAVLVQSCDGERDLVTHTFPADAAENTTPASAASLVWSALHGARAAPSAAAIFGKDTSYR